MALTRDELVARLIRAGELEVSGRDQAEIDSYFDTSKFRFRGPDGFETGYAGLTKRFTWLPGLSKSSLHAKTMAIDSKMMFVGSFNFDQRSLYLNNEIGILFHEPELAADASRRVNEHVEQVAFKVELVNRGNGSKSLQWTGTTDGKKVDFDSEPYAEFWKTAGVNMMRVLPIDSML